MVKDKTVEQKISIAKEWLEEYKDLNIFHNWEDITPNKMIDLMEEFAYQTLKVNAREILKEQGYFTDNLWHVDDVTYKFKCDEDEAQTVLYDALTGDWVMEQVQLTIHEVGDYYDFPSNE